MKKKEDKDQDIVTFTDSQFQRFERLLETYIKVTAIGAIRELTKNEMVRNTWLLNAAGYSQREIASILQTSQPTVNRIIAGKSSKGEGEDEQK